MIGVIDYQMGNLRSVLKAIEHVDAQAKVISQPSELDDIERLILPGVGAFGDGMANLKRLGFDAKIKSYIKSGRPMLGICLGMQLLFDSSDEDAPSPASPVTGLSLLSGKVVRFEGHAYGRGKLKVPHMGWNTIQWDRDDPLLRGVPQQAAVYFVHCYYCVPDQPQATASAMTDYGTSICASLWRGNLWGTQFHPEKSQRIGLQMLANFAGI